MSEIEKSKEVLLASVWWWRISSLVLFMYVVERQGWRKAMVVWMIAGILGFIAAVAIRNGYR